MEAERRQRGNSEDVSSEDIEQMINEDFADWLQQKVESQFTYHYKFYYSM